MFYTGFTPALHRCPSYYTDSDPNCTMKGGGPAGRPANIHHTGLHMFTPVLHRCYTGFTPLLHKFYIFVAPPDPLCWISQCKEEFPLRHFQTCDPHFHYTSVTPFLHQFPDSQPKTITLVCTPVSHQFHASSMQCHGVPRGGQNQQFSYLVF